MANPNNPSFASTPIPPPVFGLPFIHQDGQGQYLLTPSAIEFLQTLWASIAGTGGIIDITALLAGNPGGTQGMALALINEIAGALALLTPQSNAAAATKASEGVALLLSRPTVPSPVAATTVLNEVPGGAVDGVNVTYTLAHLPTSAGILLFQNGLLKKPTTNYSLAGGTITMVVAPPVADVLLVAYQW